MSQGKLFALLFVGLLGAAALAAYCFTHDSPILGTVNAVLAAVNLINLFRVTS